MKHTFGTTIKAGRQAPGPELEYNVSSEDAEGAIKDLVIQMIRTLGKEVSDWWFAHTIDFREEPMREYSAYLAYLLKGGEITIQEIYGHWPLAISVPVKNEYLSELKTVRSIEELQTQLNDRIENGTGEMIYIFLLTQNITKFLKWAENKILAAKDPDKQNLTRLFSAARPDCVSISTTPGARGAFASALGGRARMLTGLFLHPGRPRKELQGRILDDKMDSLREKLDAILLRKEMIGESIAQEKELPPSRYKELAFWYFKEAVDDALKMTQLREKISSELINISFSVDESADSSTIAKLIEKVRSIMRSCASSGLFPYDNPYRPSKPIRCLLNAAEVLLKHAQTMEEELRAEKEPVISAAPPGGA